MPEELVLLSFTGILAGTIVLTQLVRTLGRYWERKAGAAGRPEELAGVQGELETLRSSVDGLRQRLGEVEERVDFAERLLSRERPIDRLPQGGE